MAVTIIKKRDGEQVAFDEIKIFEAIRKANSEVDPIDQADDLTCRKIIDNIHSWYGEAGLVTVDEVQTVIENTLMYFGKYNLARKYIIYRNTRNVVRKANHTEKSILSLVANSNKEVAEENSNKNAKCASTQRDLIAGEVSKDLTMRTLLPKKIADAHEKGILHFHDADYFLQPIFNCCLVNIKDMLENGTVMNGKMIEPPKSFQVACTVVSQIIAAIGSGQYGGQSVAVKHLAPFIAVSREKIRKGLMDDGITEKALEKSLERQLKAEISAGVQTINYQLNTLMTTNGQSPFVTLFMQIDEGSEYETEQAMLIEEILRQRMQGIKNEKGVWITPAFPKLIYVLDEHNCLKGGKYDDLTRLAVKCSSKRMYPDYISAKKMRETHDGEVFSCMGCRSFLSAWKDENDNYKWEGRFNQGVVSLNLPQIGLIARGDMIKFWTLLEERLALCFEALMCRHKALLGTPSDVSPVHWQHGGIARLGKGEVIDPLLKNGYSTLSLGYIGLYETTVLMTGESHTSERGKKFAIELMQYLEMTTKRWKTITGGLGFGLYGTPAESLCYRFARIDKAQFGEISNVTDKGYYTNSYHVDVREHIDAFEKLAFESQFQAISSGGAISYVEIPNMSKNLDALCDLVRFIYDNIQYAEFNTKADYCHECGFNGEIIVKDGDWECPQCGNRNHDNMTVTRRTCGYIGENFWNVGKTIEISERVTHL